MGRREFPAKVKEQGWDRSNGECEKCGRLLSAGDVNYDHVIPDGTGGEPTLENLQVLCRSCHKAKTSGQDVPRIAKTKRVRRKHLGIRKPRRITAWRNFSGKIVRKPRER